MSIILDKVSYVYNQGTHYEKYALKDVDLVINENEFIGIIGHTGSGKSTLIQHFNGLIKPTSGSIYFYGKDISDKDFSLKDLRSHVGLTFQYPEHQLFETTVFDDVCFGPKNMGLSQLEFQQRAFDAIKLVGLSDSVYDLSPFELSGGQKRRVAIAGVLAMQPKFLILDEPTAGLDPIGKEEILQQIFKLHQENKMTIILVSHSMEDVAEYVNRIIVMDNGKKVYDDTPKKVFKHYKELEKIGLQAPEVTYILHELKAKGLDVNTDIIKIEEAKKEIIRVLRGQSR